MRARLAALIPLVPLILAHPLALAAQEREPDDREAPADTTPGHGLLNLGIHGTGISFGNSARWTGLRINFRDRGVERIDGVNLTIWKAATNANRHAVINGLAVGIVGPEGGRLNGVTLGLGGAVAHERLAGISVGGLGLVSEGEMDGINVGGLGLVADGAMRGINIGGLGAVADGGMTGLNVGGLGVVANGGMRGITLGGLGAVSNGKMEGIAIGGLGTVADGGMTGIAIGGLGTVSDGGLQGIGAGGLAVVADGGIRGAAVGGLAVVADGGIRGAAVGGLAVVADGGITGLAAGGLAVVADGGIRGAALSLGEINAQESRVEGLAATLYRIRTHETLGLMVAGWIKTTDARGVTIAAYNQIRGTQHGLAIGVFNSARELHGVQIGLLNRAKNNKPPFRWVPIVNAHLN
jgi:hypothetical protein